VQLGAHESHELTPKDGREHRVPVGDDGLRHPVEADDVGEEGLGHGLGGIRMAECDEVAVLAEAVDDGEDDRLPVDLRQRLDEIQPYVGPDHRGHWEGQQETRRP